MKMMWQWHRQKRPTPLSSSPSYLHMCVSLLCLCVCVYLVATTISLSFNQRAVPPPSHHHHSMRIPLTFLVCCASNPQVDLSLFLLLYISVSLVFFLPFLKMRVFLSSIVSVPGPRPHSLRALCNIHKSHKFSLSRRHHHHHHRLLQSAKWKVHTRTPSFWWYVCLLWTTRPSDFSDVCLPSSFSSVCVCFPLAHNNIAAVAAAAITTDAK